MLISVLISLTSFHADESIKSHYLDQVMRLDFDGAQEYARLLDKKNEVSYYRFIACMIENAGQRPSQDQALIDKLISDPDSSNVLNQLGKAAYYLYNDPANTKTFELISESILKTRKDQDAVLLKLAYFLILSVYDQEIVQSSQDYLKHLQEFGVLISTPAEQMWYHFHNIKYITKFIEPTEVREPYVGAIDSLKTHIKNNDLSDNQMAHYHFLMAVYQRYVEKSHIDSRKEYLKTIAIAGDKPFLKYLKFSSFIHMCYIETLEHNYSIALGYLDEAKQHWNQSDTLRSSFIQNLNSAVWYYAEKGDYESAYEHLWNAFKEQNKLDFRKNTLKISEMNVRLKTAEKEYEILQQQNQLTTKNRWIWTIAGFAMILVVLLVGLFIAIRNIQSKNRKIETLMRELHHRVKNNLQVVSSMLGLQSLKLEDESAKKAVTEGKSRLWAMSLIHQKLYQNEEVTFLNLNQYIEDLADALAKSYGFDRIKAVSIQISDIEMDADTALPLGLIVNEWVSNSFKYAFEGIANPQIQIKLTGERKNYQLEVKDNGIGLPQDFDMEKSSSFGMKLVSLLVKQLHGSLVMTRRNGVCYSLTFSAKS